MGSVDPVEIYLRLIESQNPLGGRYTSVSRIGPGGGNGTFSLVFSAYDQQTSSSVALKFFDPLKSTQTYRQESFRREAELLQRLAGQADILEMVEGLTEIELPLNIPGTGPLPISLMYHATPLAESDLELHIYTGSRDLTQLLIYFRACCRSVQRLHRQFIVHRDLKPGNWLIFPGNTLKLGDFGTATDLSGSVPPFLPTYRQQGSEALFRGDRWYTAPELLFGAEGHPEAFYLGDFFALGAILYEMLTQQALFPEVLDGRLLQNLGQESLLVIDEDLDRWSKEKVQELARKQPLPSIQPTEGLLPPGVETRINRVYKGLASLDYTRRWRDFQKVFFELNMCILALENQESIHRLQALRASWRTSH